MRLNNDCIRDILLYIEANTTYERSFINVNSLTNALDYDCDTIYYHLRFIYQDNLVSNVSFADNRPYIVSNLSSEGHRYVDNIRDTKVWRILKDKTKTLASVPLSVLVKLAPEVIKQLLL